MVTVAADETSFIDFDVEVDQAYRYSVVAVNSLGSSRAVAASEESRVPMGVDLMVGTINRRSTPDSNGTGFVVYLMFPEEMLSDDSDVFDFVFSGPPEWNAGSPMTFSCAWNACLRTRGFVTASVNSVTSVAGEYTISVTAGGDVYSATAELADASFRFARPTDITITNVTSDSVSVSWNPPPGAGSASVTLYVGEHESQIVGRLAPAGATSYTLSGLSLTEGEFGVEIAQHNVDYASYPIKVSSFGISYDIELFTFGD